MKGPSRWPDRTESERFWEKVDLNGPLIVGHEELGPCQLWTAALGTAKYGMFMIGSRTDSTKGNVAAYRWSWIETYGEIPEGWEPDHLCHTYDASCPGGKECKHRKCVSVLHLELVTRDENRARVKHRKSHCSHGHEFSPENTRLYKDKRFCRTCDRERVR